MRCLFSAVVTENVIDINMSLWKTGRKDLWNGSRGDDWAAMYNKQNISESMQIFCQKMWQFFILEETLY